jgi:hypothetical protein
MINDGNELWAMKLYGNCHVQVVVFSRFCCRRSKNIRIRMNDDNQRARISLIRFIQAAARISHSNDLLFRLDRPQAAIDAFHRYSDVNSIIVQLVQFVQHITHVFLLAAIPVTFRYALHTLDQVSA